MRMLNVAVCQGEENELYSPLLDSEIARFSFCASGADYEGALAMADVIFASVSFPVEAIAMAPHLRWIHVAAAGVDRFVGGSRIPEGVVLTRSAVSFGDSIAEYVLGHCLAHTQRLKDVFDHQRRKEWQPLEVSWLKGQTIGIAGTGSVGRGVADRARAMRMRVLGYARTAREIEGFERVYGPEDLLPFLSELDILVLCLPATSETRALIGARELAVMKPTAMLVNVGRGAVVDEASLIHALQAGQIEAAVLDVFEQEPLPQSSPLWAMRNVTITAHHSGPNVPEEVAACFLDNLARFAQGRQLTGVVDLERGY